MTDFAPTDVRFIKLGEKGRWEASCIADGTLRLGYENVHHELSLQGQWDEVREFWSRESLPGAGTRHFNQIHDFYTLSPNTLWITFHQRHLYWCFADPDVSEIPDDKSLVRKSIDGWSNRDLKGGLLHVANIDGRITQVQGFRGTICAVKHHEHLFRKIRGEQPPDVLAVDAAFKDLSVKVIMLIRGLWWPDFELLVDLIFTRAGWQRVAVAGKTEKNIDLDLVAPLTGKRASVQVKSSADLATLQEFVAKFKTPSDYAEIYFVVHTSSDDLLHQTLPDNVHVLAGMKLAEFVINAGLTDWLKSKCG